VRVSWCMGTDRYIITFVSEIMESKLNLYSVGLCMCVVYRQNKDGVYARDPVAGQYYMIIMVYVIPSLALLTFFVLIVSWRETLGQLRRDVSG